MKTYLVAAEHSNLVIFTEVRPSPPIPKGVDILEMDMIPDDLSMIMHNLVDQGFDIVVSPHLTHACGLRASDFKDLLDQGKAVTKIGSVDAIVDDLMEVRKKRGNTD